MKFGEIIEQKEIAAYPDSTLRNPRGRVVTVPGRMVADLLRQGFLLCDAEGNPLPLKPALNAQVKKPAEESTAETNKAKKLSR